MHRWGAHTCRVGPCSSKVPSLWPSGRLAVEVELGGVLNTQDHFMRRHASNRARNMRGQNGVPLNLIITKETVGRHGVSPVAKGLRNAGRGLGVQTLDQTNLNADYAWGLPYRYPQIEGQFLQPNRLSSTSIEGQVMQSRNPRPRSTKFVYGMIKCHTMTKAKIAITVSPLVLNRLDAWVRSEHYASRSEAIEQAVEAQLQRLERTRLAAQCALLDIDEEQAMADVGLAADAVTWPTF